MELKSTIRMTVAAAATTLLSAQSFAGTVEWNGFGSAYYSQALQDDFVPTDFENDYADFGSFSNFGLNLSSELNEELSVAGQFVAESDSSTEAWNLVTKWGFLSYRPTEAWNFKFGRQLYPAFIASEFSSVGYLLPYVRIPQAVMASAPFSGFDGISMGYQMGMGSNNLRFSLFGGSPNLSVAGIPDDAISGGIYNLMGATIEWNGEGYMFRVSAAHTEASGLTLTVENPASPGTFIDLDLTSKSNTYTAGFRWDRDNVVLWTEGVYSANTDRDATILRQSRGHYALLGYRLGRWMPRYTYSHADNDTGIFGSPNGDQTNHTIGLNYQASNQSMIKFEYETAKIADGASPTMGSRVPQTATDVDGGDKIHLGVDFIF